MLFNWQRLLAEWIHPATAFLQHPRMATTPYLFRLADRLARGIARCDEAFRSRHRQFIASQQAADGGFRGREGDADLYYTGFAARALVLLGGLARDERERLGNYVAAQRHNKLNIIDLLSWLYTGLVVQASGGSDPFSGISSNWPAELSATLESLRTRDGGYAKSAEGAAGSTYHSFLVLLAYELIGREAPNPHRLVQFVFDRQRDDGGFVEIAPMKRSGTNPTAAAVAILDRYGALDQAVREDVCGFLSDVVSDEGGFQANARIPFADGLSTFTGLLTALDLGCGDIVDSARVKSFVTGQLEFPTGGFRGAAWDDRADVEYTFYGLGILGLLNSD